MSVNQFVVGQHINSFGKLREEVWATNSYSQEGFVYCSAFAFNLFAPDVNPI